MFGINELWIEYGLWTEYGLWIENGLWIMDWIQIMDYGLDMDWIWIQYFGAKWIWIGFGIRVESIRHLCSYIYIIINPSYRIWVKPHTSISQNLFGLDPWIFQKQPIF